MYRLSFPDAVSGMGVSRTISSLPQRDKKTMRPEWHIHTFLQGGAKMSLHNASLTLDLVSDRVGSSQKDGYGSVTYVTVYQTTCSN